ncbi:hypothetical protein CEV31_1271 [Brucella thiophenivorans]|uniref:Uncharacterized protein n=1 Tax=Brucella thiophenivorans TaxID=571255 RepID=A0A256FYD8_9HYPH|nr:hypothetical protein CEV31_1271 [Brucella thiophenivorans]
MRSLAALISRGVLFPLAHYNIRSAKDATAMAIHLDLRTGIR